MKRSLRSCPRVAPAAIASVLVLGTLVGGAAAGPSKLPQQSGLVDLREQWNVRIQGAIANDNAGRSVAGAGDVNGDGRADVLVGAPNASSNGRRNSGAAYVVFGRAAVGYLDLSASGEEGFRIDGADVFDYAGHSVAAAGDVNGDGRTDLLVGAPSADTNGRSDSGAAYVVFGKTSTSAVDLAALGEGGFWIEGATAYDHAATAVAGAGDVNGDGRADLLVGAPHADTGGRSSSGAAYVVFGKTSTSAVDLAALGDGGFRIDGATSYDYAGESVAGAGDVNADGAADLLVGAPSADGNGRSWSGSAYVVFGNSANAGVDLASLGERGFRIDGAVAYDSAGTAVAGAGDVNGDGRADLLLGAPAADNNGRSLSGSAYVVFGRASVAAVDLASLGEGGFRIDGANALDRAGAVVAAAGDVNGDGRTDLLFGAPGASNSGRAESGSAYVVFTRSGVDLRALGDGGVRIDGAQVRYETGRSVASAGDFNGDRRADVLVGAPQASTSGRGSEGSAYVVYGFGTPGLAYHPLVATTGRPLAVHAPKLLERTGIPSFRVSPWLPDGLDIDPATGAVSGTPAGAQRQTTHVVTMDDLAGSVSAPLTITIRDTTAPTLKLSGSSDQRVLRRGSVIVHASCDEACRLHASGLVAVLGTGASVGLREAKATLRESGKTRLSLALSPAARRKLARLLGGGRPARVTVTVRAVDRSGNASAARRTIVVSG